ncbi:hypothetical protein B9Z55_028495 [Caenorhabditis nigoni]|uniref:MULE transposase domain-containing protein n=1 Tax=Caenorhabditis nigoni TaxID=1611254 RepID=A0A2G5SB92_9PELO|nr:hypothetical protein B9Z55_028495 [Caenorhabditis nigoni]
MSRQDRPIELIDGYAMRYIRTRKNDGLKLYYCTERNRRSRCGGAFWVDSFNKSFTVKSPHERHDKDQIRSNSFMFRQDLKKTANTGTPRTVIDDVRSQFSPAVSLAAGTYDAQRKVIYAAKERCSVATVEMNKGGPISQEFQKTKNGEQFLLADETFGNSRVIVFASEDCLDVLCDSKIVLADGTFDVSPTGFTQLFTIHSYVSSTAVRPLAYCFLTDKKEQTYTKAIQILKSHPILANWEPEMMICDYEQAIKNAFSKEFQNISIEGCLFHIFQNWRREAEKLKVYEEFIGGSILDFWPRLKAIAFIPPAETEQYYNLLLTTIPVNQPAELNSFLLYLERNYMTAAARFPSTQWSCNFRTLHGIHRTTNSVEVWHRTISKVVTGKNGMSVVKMSDVLAKILIEDRHTRHDIGELKINPNHQVNKTRTFTNLLKDRKILKVLENDPAPPNHPLAGINFLDAICFATAV